MSAEAAPRSSSPIGGAPWTFRVVQDDPLVVALGGELDTMTGPLMGERLFEALKGSTGPARIELDDVTFIDSQGLSTLIEGHQLDPKRRITLANPRANVRRLIEITGLAQVFPIE